MMEENFGIYLWLASMALLLGLLIALVAGIPMATFLAVFAALLVSPTLVFVAPKLLRLKRDK